MNSSLLANAFAAGMHIGSLPSESAPVPARGTGPGWPGTNGLTPRVTPGRGEDHDN
jgi:hypothetical protein